jgi:hypothetical protein
VCLLITQPQYTMDSVGKGCARGAVSVSSGRRVSNRMVVGNRRAVEYPAFVHGLPLKYLGAVVPRDPGRKLLTLAANFMDASYEPVCSGFGPMRAILAGCWQQVAKSIWNSSDHKTIPEPLKKAAMKARTRLYVPVVDLVDEPDAVEKHTADPVADSRRNKRPRASDSRSRADMSSASSAGVTADLDEGSRPTHRPARVLSGAGVAVPVRLPSWWFLPRQTPVGASVCTTEFPRMRFGF